MKDSMRMSSNQHDKFFKQVNMFRFFWCVLVFDVRALSKFKSMGLFLRFFPQPKREPEVLKYNLNQLLGGEKKKLNASPDGFSTVAEYFGRGVIW